MKTAEDLALAALEAEKQRRLEKINFPISNPIRGSATFSRPVRNTASDCYSQQIKLGKLMREQWKSRFMPQEGTLNLGPAIASIIRFAIWVCGESSEVVRETIQRLLLGEPGYHGTGTIPKDALLEVVPARGTPELVDTIRVRHASGGSSTIGLKSYSQGRERFQGSTLDFAWCGETALKDLLLNLRS